MNTVKNRALNGLQAAGEAVRQLKPDYLLMLRPLRRDSLSAYLYNLTSEKMSEAKVVQFASPLSLIEFAGRLTSNGARVSISATAEEVLAMQPFLARLSLSRSSLIINVVSGYSGDDSELIGSEDLLNATSFTGWLQLLPGNAQEIYDANLLAVKLAEDRDIRLPVMIIQDQNSLGSWVEGVKLLSDEAALKFLGPRFPVSEESGVLANNVGLEANLRFRRNTNIQSLDKYQNLQNNLSEFTNRNLPAVELYGPSGGQKMLVTFGAANGLGRLAVDAYNVKAPKKANQLLIRLMRPLPGTLIKNLAAGFKSIGLAETVVAPGSNSLLFNDFAALFFNDPEMKLKTFSLGLAGKETGVEELREVLERLEG